MKRTMLLAGLLLACCALVSCKQSSPPRGNPNAMPPGVRTKDAAELVTRARDVVDRIAKGDYEGATRNFDAKMKEALTPEKAKEAWQKLVAQAGPFRRRLAERMAKDQQYDLVYVTCQFENGPVDIALVFDANKLITGLWFVPAASR
jgi:uncharacterized protein